MEWKQKSELLKIAAAKWDWEVGNNSSGQTNDPKVLSSKTEFIMTQQLFPEKDTNVKCCRFIQFYYFQSSFRLTCNLNLKGGQKPLTHWRIQTMLQIDFSYSKHGRN